jgi:hypothetical protein
MTVRSIFSKKIMLGTLGAITLITSEIMPFIPQIKGNGLLDSLVDGYIYNKNLIEKITNKDLDGDGTIGAKKVNNDLQKLDFLKELKPGMNYLSYKTVLDNKKIMTVKISITNE